MRLYYTTTIGFNNEQPNPDRSLGGFKASTPVVNDDFSNIFDEISVMTIRSDRDEYRAIMLVNEFSVTCTNVRIRIEQGDEDICSYKLAIGQLDIVNKYGQKSMENVLSQTNKPFRAQFVDMTPDAVLTVGNLKASEAIGIWVCRHVDKELAKKQYNDVCRPDPKDPTGRRYIPVDHPTQESVNMIIEWD